MAGEPATGNQGSVKQLDLLLNEQIGLFKDIVQQNATLQKRVVELEGDMCAFREAFKSADNERKSLRQRDTNLERATAIKEESPLILCLIDGDGNIFSSDLLRQGKAGGRLAATQLTRGITEYEPSTRGQVWLTVYCNKTGLLDVLRRHNKCTAKEFDDFVLGFNQASPLFSIVDVGGMKEAADAKIREYLRIFTRFPQISRVFFGGGHDNGYTSTLNYLETEGLLNKVTILTGYKNLAADIRGFRLPQLCVEGVFMRQRLSSSELAPSGPTSRPLGSRFSDTPSASRPLETRFSDTPSASRPLETRISDGPSAYQPLESRISDGPSTSQPVESRSSDGPSQSLESRISDGPEGLSQESQTSSAVSGPSSQSQARLCTFHYFGGSCLLGDKCIFRHDHIATTQEELDSVHEDAKRIPCAKVNADKNCLQGSSCPWAHACPAGSRCTSNQKGTCIFKGSIMHYTTKTSQNLTAHHGPLSAPPNVGGAASSSSTSKAESSTYPLLGIAAGSTEASVWSHATTASGPAGALGLGHGSALHAAIGALESGTFGIPFCPYAEQEHNCRVSFESFSASPGYRGVSHEELRVRDYLRGHVPDGTYGQSPFGPAKTPFGFPFCNKTLSGGAFDQQINIFSGRSQKA